LTNFCGVGKRAVDHVTRRFSASSAGLKKPVGLDLRCYRRFARSPDSTGALSQPKSGRCLKAPREDGSWFRAELDCSQCSLTIQLNKKMKIKNMTTRHLKKSIGRSLSGRCSFVLIPLALACFALVQNTQAQLPAPSPDGGYPGANTAEGDNALLNLTSGLANTAVGNGALRDNTTGGFNVAVGSRALASNITGSFNMAIGTEALTNNTANFNLAIGFRVGYLNTTGNHLTGIGAAALRNNTTASFNTAIGADALRENTTGEDNTAIGADALTLNIGAGSNTAVGFQALENNDSSGNGFAVNNAALGSGALQDNVDGTDDTAVGFQAMQFNVSAFTNAALGTFAAQNNDSSGAGTAVFNTAVGGFALKDNVDGTRNTAVGAGALELANGGNDNTAVGEIAGLGITTHSNIIAIGSGVSGVDSALGEVDNACYIGNISGASVSVGTFAFVFVDASGKLGTVTVDANGNKVTIPGLPSLPGANPPQAVPQRVQPKAIGPDPKQAMLNRKVEELQVTVARQQKQIDALSAGLQKVSAQLEVSKPAPQVVGNQ